MGRFGGIIWKAGTAYCNKEGKEVRVCIWAAPQRSEGLAGVSKIILCPEDPFTIGAEKQREGQVSAPCQLLFCFIYMRPFDPHSNPMEEALRLTHFIDEKSEAHLLPSQIGRAHV